MHNFKPGDKVKILHWTGSPQDVTLGKVYPLLRRNGMDGSLGFLDDDKYFRDALSCITEFIIVSQEWDE